MNDLNVRAVQIGSFFEMYVLDLRYFEKIKEEAYTKNIHIRSMFTAHRELGGFFYDNIYMEKAARSMYERLIDVASFLGADYCGSNPGAVYRDQMSKKADGIACYLKHMKELSFYASEKGLKGLTIEPMSCAAEPPTSVTEIRTMMTELNNFHLQNPESTVPFYLCGDISHGWAGTDREIISTNYELFEVAIPWMCEFHYKNTDRYFESTFGFSEKEQLLGIVDINQISQLINKNRHQFPVWPITGYLEIGGPKIGRDYSDKWLAKCLIESITSIRKSLQ
ncbi:MAG: sugar phosphate isomerase/epimerase [Prolixibacteraceae bacterium]|nr:sugar phosphate isomerase/epimerase [Prolixibacteraceae bacterium]